MPRRRRLLVALALGLSVLAYASWAGYVRLCGPGVESNARVGRTASQIWNIYGTPDEDMPGYETLGLDKPPSLPSGPIRTLIFKPSGLFHPESGTLWVWVTKQNGEWVCFESCWFAAGVDF